MIYQLSNIQWAKLWLEVFPDWQLGPESNMVLEYHNRLKIFDEKFPQLQYSEYDDRNDPGYFGIIIGDEKYINWIIMLL